MKVSVDPTGARAAEALIRYSIEREYREIQARLPEPERAVFADYYANLPAPGRTAAIRTYLRGFSRGEAGWLARWIGKRLAVTGRRPRLMDAGSGFGTFAMYFAAAGADVVGVDLRPDRLEVARRRAEFHASAQGAPLPVRYERWDLTQEWRETYDAVWVYNALSHIDPLEGFLQQVRAHLAPDGVLVIGDINGAHPEHRARLQVLRGDDVHQHYVAPDGTSHAYAVERAFPPGELRTLLAAHRLRVVRHEMYLRGSAALPRWLYLGAASPLQRRWWLWPGVARRQLVVASPA